MLVTAGVLLGCEGTPVGGTDGAPQRPGVGAPQENTPTTHPGTDWPTAPPTAPHGQPSARPTLGAAPSGAPLDRTEITRLCGAICDSTRALPCGNLPECQGECANSFGLTVCKVELGAMLVCTAKTAPSGFVCGPQGPSLREGSCEREQEAAADCLAAVMQQAAEKNAAAQ